jgi:hypothetical protein
MFYVYRVEDKITKEYYIGSRKYNGKNIEEWVLGTLQKNKKTISSHYDRIWITNGVNNKRVKEEDFLKEKNNYERIKNVWIS